MFLFLSYLLFLCVWLFVVFGVHGRLRLSRLTRDRGVREGRVVRRSKKGLKRNRDEDMFNDMFKKDFIKVTLMKAWRKLNRMRINPYPNTVLRCGLKRKEPREDTDPILEEVMIYSAMVGTETLGTRTQIPSGNMLDTL